MSTTQSLFARLLPTLLEGKIIAVHVGLYWTAVLAEVDGETRCGLAATVGDESHHFTTEPLIAHAGHLTARSARELADYVYSPVAPEVSIGLATINALLPRQPAQWVNLHAKQLLAQLGAGKNVAMVGHFPYVPALRPQVGQLWVLEQNPQEGDLPAAAAADIIPQADVVAITAMTLLNGTFDELIALCPPSVPVLIVGPSTPLSPVLFEMGATMLAGAIVESPERVLRGLHEGANFHQLRQMGVRLVALTADGS